MFIENLSLSRGLPFEVKVDDVSDAVLQALTVATHRGSVAATVGFGDILNAIRSADVRSGTLELLGLSVAKVEETAVVEVVDEAVDEVQEASLEVIEEGAKQEVGETETDKDVLDAIIRGQTVHVVKHLKANQLSKEDKAYLLEKERAGKARYQVIALLNDE